MKRIPAFFISLLLGLAAGCESSKSQTVTLPKIDLVPVANALPKQVDQQYNANEIDVLPKYEGIVPNPGFPYELRRRGITGFAKVYFVVRANGSVSDIVVLESNDTRFAKAASAAIQKCRFSPGLKNGYPVDCRMIMPIEFNINSR